MQISYTPEELQKVKNAEVVILKEVICCCESLNIPYFLAYGTALGAVRHKGFIPWDDDIDIGLTRPNYERFLKETPKWFEKKNMFLEHISTEKNCPYAYAKVRLNDTEFVEYCNRNIDMHQGIYIDVFPFDEIPEDIEKQKEQYLKAQKLVKKYVYRQTPDITEKPDCFKLYIKQGLRRLLYWFMRIHNAKDIYKELTEVMTQYNGTDSGVYGCLFYPKFKAGCMTKKMISDLSIVDFEGMKVTAPGDVEQYLTSQYGDYMKLPPVEQRVGHRPYKVKI